MMILKWQPPGTVTLSETSVESITDTFNTKGHPDGREGWAQKTAKLKSYCTQRKGNMGEMIDISKSTVKLLEQC